jgi:hypothetical protein
MRFPHVILISLVLSLASRPLFGQEHNYRPAQGLVPDAKTAIAIAVAIWTPIYGEKQIASERPYVASLADGKWTVRGSLPKGWSGGVAVAVIAKSDGQVSRISHGK